MRAMAIVGEFGLDHLKLIERPVPTPRHGEVVIRMSAVSLNYRDMDMVLGTYPFKFPLPLVPTSDGVGEVVAVGDGGLMLHAGVGNFDEFVAILVEGIFAEVVLVGVEHRRNKSRRRPSHAWRQ